MAVHHNSTEHTTGGRDHEDRAALGMAKFGAKKIWHQFVNATENLVPNPQIVASHAREWRLVFPMGRWSVAVISYSFWMVGWMAALISWRLSGTMKMCMPRELKMTRTKWLRTFKYRGIIRLTFVVPNSAIPNFACS